MSAHLSERNRPLSAREREQIRNRMRMNEAALQGRIVMPTNRGTGPEGISDRRLGRYQSFLRDEVREDSGILRAHIARDQKLLDRTDPARLNKRQRQKLEEQCKRDIEFIKKKMCPQTLFHVPRVKPDGMPHPDFQRAVEACKREHTAEYQSVANRLKENLRRIDPDNESNLERFRPNS